MARITTPLSPTEVKQAKPKDKEYSLYDGNGLILRVKPNGSKLWLFNYFRPYTKKRANLGLGQYPALSIASARKKREEFLTLLAENIDPQTHRETQKIRNLDTLKLIAEKWLEIKRNQVSPDSANDIWRSLELHIFPCLGNTPISQITAPTMIATLEPLAAKGAHEQVRRICQRVNEVMSYAVNAGLIEHNTLSGIKHVFQTPKKKHMATIKPEQLPQFMKTLFNANITITTRNLILWQLHTMVRPSEAAGLRWDELHLEDNVWIIPAERMKKKKEHRVPLTASTLDILDTMRPIHGKYEYVFAGDRNKHKPCNSSTANAAIKRMGFHGELVAHGLRSIASTALNEQGFDAELIECCLAHVDKNAVRAAYNRSDYLERRRKLMEAWSDQINAAIAGGFTHSVRGLRLVNE